MKPILIHVIFDRIHRIWEVEQVSFPLPGLDQCDEHIESIAFKGVAFRRHQAIDFLEDAAVIMLGLASIVSYWRCVPMNRFTSAGVAQSLRCIPAKRDRRRRHGARGDATRRTGRAGLRHSLYDSKSAPPFWVRRDNNNDQGPSPRERKGLGPARGKPLPGLYRTARVGLVTPLRDGMNLVAKEYVTAQDSNDPGVLILSRFAGAAVGGKRARLVNPYDAESVAGAMAQALSTSVDERRDSRRPRPYRLQHNTWPAFS
jgi:Glycosyltransferase family 20